MKHHVAFFLLLQVFALGAAGAATPAQKVLNKESVIELYSSGEFEALVKLLEDVRRDRQLRNREDSVFIYKFLGVIYGANDATRKKAESFLYQMLKLSPEETLTTLGVGDSIEAIFERVRQRYSEVEEGIKPWEHSPDTVLVYVAPGEEGNGSSQPQPQPQSHAEPGAKESRPRWIYYAVGAGAVGAGILAWMLLSGGDDGGDSNQPVEL